MPSLRRLATEISSTWVVDRVLGTLGVDVVLPLEGQELRLHPRWRSRTLAADAATVRSWLALVRPGDMIWDVGGAVGLYSLLAGLKTGKAGRVVVWEPSPERLRYLIHHVRINGLSPITTVLNEIIQEGSAPKVRFRGEEVYANSLDRWADRLGRAPDLIRLDIRGGESRALRGAREIFSCRYGRLPPILLFLRKPPGELAEAVRAIRYRALDTRGESARYVPGSDVWLVPEAEADAFARRLADVNDKASRRGAVA